MEKCLCVITARGGSKRIPQKNIRTFCGEPMISWPIKRAQRAGIFDRVIISTECATIAGIAESYGVERPFFRPLDLADDFSSTMDVLYHAIQELARLGPIPSFACCLYGTSCFLSSESLVRAYTLLLSGDVEWVFAMSEFAHPPQRGLKLQPNGFMDYVSPEHVPCRTQDLERLYHDIGLFYFFPTDVFLGSTVPLLANLSKKGVLVPRLQAIDIDTEDDWQLAEKLFKILEIA